MWVKSAILFLILNSVLLSSAHSLNPSTTYSSSPQKTGLKCEEIFIYESDGTKLSAWYFPSNGNDKLIIMSHDGVGNMGNYLNRVKALVKYGFSVLAYDYRGYGTSSDFKINNLQFIYKEFYDDFDTVLKYCNDRFQKEIIAYGWGIGGGISIARGFNNSSVTGIISDDPFMDFSILQESFERLQAIMVIPNEIGNTKYNPSEVIKSAPNKNLRGVLYLYSNQNILYSNTDMNIMLDATNIDTKELIVYKRPKILSQFNIAQSNYPRDIYAFVMNL